MVRKWPYSGHPATFKELFEFYTRYVKLLYAEVQIQNALPVETLFELNATFDHISTHWSYGRPEDQVVDHAFGHLKRACLDIFKLKVRTAREQYDAQCSLDTSEIEDGEFDRRLHQLFNKIRTEATEARRLEGKVDSSNEVPAFENWEEVYVKCLQLEQEYFLHPEINWRRRNAFPGFIRRNAWGFVLGMAVSLLAAVIGYLAVLH